MRFIFHRLAFQKFNFAIEVGNLLVNGPTKRNPNPKWSNLVMTREAKDLKDLDELSRTIHFGPAR